MNGLPIPKGRQREVLYLPAEGHTVVLGTAGSGKTTMALLRAVYLQEQHTQPPEKTLLLTFNRMLVAYIRSLGESVPGGLVVENYHKTARGFLSSRKKMPNNSIAGPDARKILIIRALASQKRAKSPSILDRSTEFFEDEFIWIARCGIRTLDEYVKAKRTGRKGTHVDRASRESVWSVYQQYLNFRLQQGFLYDWDDIAAYVEQELTVSNSDWAYRHIVIDEGQDFSPTMIRSLASAIPANGCLTFFGDVAQQIYGIRVSWKEAGLKPPKIWQFKENYRNSGEIAKLALAVAKLPPFADEPDIVSPNTPIAAGPLPALIKFSSNLAETNFVINRATDLGLTQKVAVLLRTRDQVRAYISMMQRKCKALISELHPDRGNLLVTPGVMVGTYQSAKGLEFEAVFVPKCESSQWPDPDRLSNVGYDEASAEDIRLLYVGITRARTLLYISFVTELTHLLPNDVSLYDYSEM